MCTLTTSVYGWEQMSDKPSLTPRQQQIYDFISERIHEWGFPPTIREIGEHLGIRSTNGVADHLKALKRKGYLQQQGSKSRTWQPLGEGRRDRRAAALRSVDVPLLGRVAAGEPILAEEQAEDSVCVDTTWVGGEGRRVFALKVVGQSMIEAGILDGDTIFVDKRESADPGDIVVAMIDNEATVKRYFPEGDRVRLQPENATLEPIYVSAHDARAVQLMGVVVGVYRRL
jgi:repressor LexA